MSGFKGSAPRYFEPTNIKRGNRFEHIMVAGGRDGPEIANVPPKDPGYWKDGESRRWTAELELGETPLNARTQSPLLREVRPLQRLWEKGYMTGAEMMEAIEANRLSPYTKTGAPDVELTVIEMTQAGPRFGRVRVTLVDAPVFAGLSPDSKAVGSPVDLKTVTAEGLAQLGKALAELRVFSAPLYVTTKNLDGNPIKIELSKAAATAKGVRGKFVGAPNSMGIRWMRKTKEGQKAVEVGEEVEISRGALLRVSLFDTEKPETLDLPSWRRSNGVLVKLRDVLSGQEYSADPITLPFSLIARIKSIYPQDPARPARLISQYSGDTSKPEKVRERLAKELEKFRQDAILTMYKKARKIERGKASPDPFIAFMGTGFMMRLNEAQQLVWADRPGPGGLNPVALLRSTQDGAGDILVTPDNVLMLIRQARSLKKRGNRKKKPETMTNPPRGLMRNFTNPVHYLSDSEIAAMAEMEGLTVAQLMRKYDGRIQRKADRPRGETAMQPAYISAGRRAAVTGAGLDIRRNGAEMTSAEMSVMADAVQEMLSKGVSHRDVQEGLGLTDAQYRSVLKRAQMQQVKTNPSRRAFRVTMRHPIEGEVVIGIFPSRNQAEDAGAAYRSEGRIMITEVAVAGNPRQFRGVKQAQTPKERKTANLYARAEQAAGHIPLETLLTGYGEEGEVGLPALADVQAHRGEKRASRDYAQREGTYKRLRKPNVDNQEAYLQSLAEHAPFLYHEEARGVDAYRARYASQQETKAHMKEVGRKGRAFIKSKLNPAYDDDEPKIETITHPRFYKNAIVLLDERGDFYPELSGQLHGDLKVEGVERHTNVGGASMVVVTVTDDHGHLERVFESEIKLAPWSRRPARRTDEDNF